MRIHGGRTRDDIAAAIPIDRVADNVPMSTRPAAYTLMLEWHRSAQDDMVIIAIQAAAFGERRIVRMHARPGIPAGHYQLVSIHESATTFSCTLYGPLGVGSVETGTLNT